MNKHCVRNIAALALMTLLVGCTAPMGPLVNIIEEDQGSTSRVTVSVSLGIATIQTIVPTFPSDQIASYVVSFAGPAPVSPVVVDAPDSQADIELQYGTWDISVSAYDASDIRLAYGTTTATIEAPISEISVQIGPSQSGSGSVLVQVEWPPTQPVDTVIADVVDEIIGIDFIVNQETRKASWYEPVMGSGDDHILKLGIKNAAGEYILGPITEVLHFWDNILTEKSYIFTEADFQDQTPPGDVSNLTATAGIEQAELSWTSPADDDLHHVEVTCAPQDGPSQPMYVYANSCTITELSNGPDYSFTVKSVDRVGNVSDPGASTNVTVISPPILSSGESVEEYIESEGNKDWYKICLTAGNLAVVEFQQPAPTTSLYPYVYFIAPDGATAIEYANFSNSSSGSGIDGGLDVQQIAETGWYYLRVQDSSTRYDPTTPYTLTVTEMSDPDPRDPDNNTTTGAYAMTSGTPVTDGYLASDSDIDWYAIQLTAGNIVEVRYQQGTPTMALYPEVSLFTPDGSTLVEYSYLTNSTSGSGVDFALDVQTATETGWYLIRVRDYYWFNEDDDERDAKYDYTTPYTLTVNVSG